MGRPPSAAVGLRRPRRLGAAVPRARSRDGAVARQAVQRCSPSSRGSKGCAGDFAEADELLDEAAALAGDEPRREIACRAGARPGAALERRPGGRAAAFRLGVVDSPCGRARASSRRTRRTWPPSPRRTATACSSWTSAASSSPRRATRPAYWAGPLLNNLGWAFYEAGELRGRRSTPSSGRSQRASGPATSRSRSRSPATPSARRSAHWAARPKPATLLERCVEWADLVGRAGRLVPRGARRGLRRPRPRRRRARAGPARAAAARTATTRRSDDSDRGARLRGLAGRPRRRGRAGPRPSSRSSVSCRSNRPAQSDDRSGAASIRAAVREALQRADEHGELEVDRGDAVRARSHARPVEHRLPLDELRGTRAAVPGATLGPLRLELEQVALQRLLEAGERGLDTVGRVPEAPPGARPASPAPRRRPRQRSSSRQNASADASQARSWRISRRAVSSVAACSREDVGPAVHQIHTSMITGRIIGRRRVRS